MYTRRCILTVTASSSSQNPLSLAQFSQQRDAHSLTTHVFRSRPVSRYSLASWQCAVLPQLPLFRPSSTSGRVCVSAYLQLAVVLTSGTTAGLSGLAIFVAVSTFLLSSFLLAVPVIYDKYDKFHGVARALRELRVAFIVNGAGAILGFLAAYVFCLALPGLATRTLRRGTTPASQTII